MFWSILWDPIVRAHLARQGRLRFMLCDAMTEIKIVTVQVEPVDIIRLPMI
jgi:hypothetical protein